MVRGVDGEIVVEVLELDVHGADMMVDAWVEYYENMVYGMRVLYGMNVVLVLWDP